MEKWNLPKEPVPSWLNASKEVTISAPKCGEIGFILTCMESLLCLPDLSACRVERAAGIVANSMNETGRGKFYKGNNLGGWKTSKAYADWFKKMYGADSLWWRAPGNKAPGATTTDLKGGDPPWCYYKAFSSIRSYFSEWRRLFVPRPEVPDKELGGYRIYRECGRAFWTGKEWFPLLVKAGYKGERTKNAPDGAIAEHRLLTREAITRWGQSKLRVDPDNNWGPKSTAACIEFQEAAGLSKTGELNSVTLERLSALRAE